MLALRHVAAAQLARHTMSKEHTPLTPNATDAEWPVEGVEEELDDEIDTAGELHRLAAHHFAAAAKYHLLAATADDEGDNEANARYAHLAYRHQLNGTQYAEIAVMDNDSLEEDEGI
jgi:hypothetical protein